MHAPTLAQPPCVCSAAYLCLILRPPWTVAHQAPLSMGLFRQQYWHVLPLPSPGDLPNPGIEPISPALQADSLLLHHLGGPTQLLCGDAVYGGHFFFTPKKENEKRFALYCKRLLFPHQPRE